VYLLPPGRLAEGEIGRISLSEVADAPLMMPGAPNIIYKRLTAAFELIGHQPVILAEIDALTSIVEAVIEGVGAAVLPWAALRHAGNPVIDAYRITDPVLSRRMFLSHSTFSPLTRAAANIRDIVIQETQQLVRSGRWKAVSLT